MADLGRLETSIIQFPDALLNQKIPGNLNEIIEKNMDCPIVDTTGKNHGYWEIKMLLEAILDFRRQKKETTSLLSTSTIDTKTKKTSHLISRSFQEEQTTWLMQLILASFPWSIYTSDLKGNALFYNESFTEDIVNSSFFSYSLQKSEVFFIRSSTELIGRKYFKKFRGFGNT